MCFFFFFKQKTAYEMRISDWSSDVCSSDLTACDFSLAIEFGDAAPEFGNDLDARNVTDRDRNAAGAHLQRYVSEIVEALQIATDTDHVLGFRTLNNRAASLVICRLQDRKSVG